MTAMVAGGLIPVIIRRVTHIDDSALMFIYFIAMAVKRPYRAVSNSADDKPYHEKAFEHTSSLHHFSRVFEKVGNYIISFIHGEPLQAFPEPDHRNLHNRGEQRYRVSVEGDIGLRKTRGRGNIRYRAALQSRITENPEAIGLCQQLEQGAQALELHCMHYYSYVFMLIRVTA